MQLKEVTGHLAGVPFTTPNKGKFFYEFIAQHKFRNVLELGFAHGCSTCYFAAALQELGGHIDAVDLEVSAGFQPSLEQLSARLGLQGVITPYREKSSYTWYLKKKIEKQSGTGTCEPCYDMIFIDGPKDWTNDGAAFFMADKLLRPGGFIMFDDFSWSYRKHEHVTGKRYDHGYVFANMSEQEFDEPQIGKLFQLLVMQHPDYSEFRVVDEELAVARKVTATRARTLTLTTRKSMGYRISHALRTALRRGA